MKITIRSKSIYRYAEAASFSPHIVRLFPRNDRSVRVERILFQTHETADIQYRRDLFDNEVAVCFFPEKSTDLEFTIELDLAITERNPFHFLVDSHALELPFAYQPHEAAVLAPYRQPVKIPNLPEALTPVSNKRPTVETIVALNEWIFKSLGYERREEGEARPSAETLTLGMGACRDFAVLLVEVLRLHGIAARLASGFLWEPADTPEEDLRAQSALHAWVEAYIPGAGWLGLDPTNGVLCDHHRINAAVGLIADDISPIKGSYYGKSRIESHMESSLEIVER